MFSPVSKLSFGLLFFVGVILSEFGLMKAQILKAERARDLYWQLEIAKVSLKAKFEQERQRKAAWAAEHQAQTTISALKQELVKMEKVNGILPTTGCVIGVERVRLLNKQAGG
ncbi:hypothetical protein [Bartonella taylorii]|uniref:hypothetical protein n=1 Tax=Bartonella taylorii TaxID=33046 RepID=UPI001ABAA713|nr:hypothetical protein [Bartonella taylorii]